MEELERTAESPAVTSSPRGRLELHDATTALRRAEQIAGARVLGDLAGEAAEALAAAHAAASKGERVCVLARAEALTASRDGMRRIARERLGMVAHAMGGHGGEELSAFADLGWGVLLASGPEDSFDLTLVARRAAEDAGVPFLVVHALGEGSAGRVVAMVSIPAENAIEGFVGAKRNVDADPSRGPLSDRSFGDRVPFALGSALRELAPLTGRRHDAFDRMPLAEPQLVIVAMGAIGDALLSAVGELRARGYDVGVVHVSAMRPFPGARLVKALSRALAITILEPADEPLAQGGLLVRELKSAFADAMTWAPGFSGIGRIPKFFTGVTGPSFGIEDLAAICENMLADERGRRTFSLVDPDQSLPRPQTVAVPLAGQVVLRWVLEQAEVAERAIAATSAVLAETLGLRAHTIVSVHDGMATIDLLATRDARGGMARRAPRLVLASEKGALRSEAVTPLSPGAIFGILSSAALSDATRAVARERRVRVVPLPTEGADVDPSMAIAATCAGASAAVAFRAQRAAVDALQVARVVAEHFRGMPHADVAGERARRAFEVTHEAVLAAEVT